jgi:CHAT domain-containing protein
MFAWLRERPAAGDPTRRLTLLALGDPTFAPADKNGPIARLPATRTEVQAIARLFSRSELLLGPEATAQNLDRMAAGGELSKFRYLHFATHGLLDERLPLASTLQLAQDRSVQDGRLTAEHVLRTWKLDADLVTLSACESGRGKYSVGEGYLGFSQALFIAGARSMALSLWPVDDRATTLLMTRFYENMLGTPDGRATPLPKAEALAEAKRWLADLTAGEVDRLTAEVPRGLPAGTRGTRRVSDAPPPKDAPRPFSHPSYWSAFILIGDPR